MSLLLNGIEFEDGAVINANNRALQFGDGIFETIIVHQGDIRFGEDHYNRMVNGMRSLYLDFKSLSIESFEEQISNICAINDLHSARVKFMVIRKTTNDVGYKSSTREFDTLLLAKPMTEPGIITYNKVSKSENIKLNYSSFSSFKSINSLPYVLAEIEKEEMNLDELILLDSNNHVSECSSSNIFWIKNDQLYTSPISTGCKDGIMRKQIMQIVRTEETPISYENLKSAQCVFCTNIARIGIFNSIDQVNLITNHSILDQIKPLWVL